MPYFNFQFKFIRGLSALFVLMLAFIVLPAEAQGPDECASPGLETLQRPVRSGSFPYKFKYFKGSNPDLPVVIFLPGGPGQSSISGADDRIFDSYGLIQTDPRGTGCNSTYWSYSDELSTEVLAEDIIAIIRHLNLRNYYLYGISYGTVLATVVASKIEAQSLTPPRALILEGTVGRAFEENEDFEGYVFEWNKIRSKLKPKNLEFLKSASEPLGYTSGEWGKFLGGMLNRGASPRDPDLIELDLYLGFHASSVFKDWLTDTLDIFATPHPEGMEKVYQRVGCRELSPGWRTDIFLVNGELVEAPTDNDICNRYPMQIPFDAVNYPVTQSKIIYFSGTNDPSTPEWQTLHHIHSQPYVLRTWISVIGGGHNALKHNLSDCKENVWRSLLLDDASIENGLNSCTLRSQVTNF